jgi:hypothetical protein
LTAPIIALANQFTLTESFRIWMDAWWLPRISSNRKMSDRDRRNVQRFQRFQRLALVPVGLGAVNMIAQLVALGLALSSLADRQDDFSMTVAAVIVLYGLAVVAFAAVCVGYLQSTRVLLDLVAKDQASSDLRTVRARSKIVKSVSVKSGLGWRQS